MLVGANNEVQVGSTPEHCVVFNDLTADEVKWLRSMATANIGVGARGPAMLSERQEEALALLDAVGLLDPGQDPTSTLSVQLTGLGAVGTQVALALARIPVRRLECRDDRPLSGSDGPLFGAASLGARRASVVRAMVDEIAPRACTGKISVPDVAVICSERQADHEAAGFMLSQDTPHLVVTSDDRVVSVGPVVIPGVTPCALCCELNEQQASPRPGDPLLLRAAVRTAAPPLVRNHLATAAAGMTVGLVRQLASGAVSPGRVLRMTEGTVTTVEHDFNDRCGCAGLAKPATSDQGRAAA